MLFLCPLSTQYCDLGDFGMMKWKGTWKVLVPSYFKYFWMNIIVLYNFKNTYTAVVKAAKSAFNAVFARPPSMHVP